MASRKEDHTNISINIHRDMHKKLKERAKKEHRCPGNMALILIIKGLEEN